MKKEIFMVAAVLIGSQLQAQQDTTILDPVILTANKFEQKQSQTGKVVTIISKEQLEKSAGKTVAQLLNEQAGISIAGAYNNAGSIQTVFMRGASTGRTQILLDGVPVNDPSMIYNEFDLNLFSVNDIERIEICRGAQSTLYGSDAIAGVINITTIKKDVTQPFNLKATTGFGNKNTFRSNVQAFGRMNRLLYTVRFARLNTAGFSSAYDRTGGKNFDNDGYDGNVTNASLQYQVMPELILKAFIQYSRYKADVDAGVFADEKDFTIRNSNLLSGFGATFKKGIVSITTNYQYGKMSRKYRNDSLDMPGFTRFESNIYKSNTHFAELYGNANAAGWLTVLAGLDYRKGAMNQQYLSISSFGPYDPPAFDSSLHQTSFYSSFFFSLIQKKLNVEIGGRMNRHSRYGTNSTYTFNPSFIIDKQWRIFGSIASGFKAPSIFQLYDAFSGNKDLKPEKSVNYEGGVQFSHTMFSSRLIYFYRNIKNGIDFDYTTFSYFNFIKQKVNGIELELSANPVKHVGIMLNYAYIKAKEQTQSRKDFSDTAYNYVLRRPKHNLNVSISYQPCDDLYFSITGKSVSKRYDTGGYQADDVLLNSYFLLSAYAEYTWRHDVKFFADLQNITDRKFFDISGYNAIPLLINGGITFTL